MAENDSEVPANEKRSVLGVPISETILLAAAPFLAYLFTFVYQAGYFDAFGLPRQFILLNLSDVLNFGGKVVLVFAVILAAINLPLSLLPRKIHDHPSLASRASLLMLLLLLAIPLLFFYSTGKAGVLLWGILVFTFGVMFLPPLLTRRFKGSYLQKMEALDRKVIYVWEGSGSLVYGLANIIGYKSFVLIVYFVASICLTYNVGIAWGANQITFPIASALPKEVVLFMASDRLITAPFDPQSKTIEPVFTFLDIGDKSGMTIRFADVGPLKLKAKGAIRGQQDGSRGRRPPHSGSKSATKP